MIEDINRLAKGKSPINITEEKINEAMDIFKNKSACVPRAYIINPKLQQAAKNLAYQEENISISKSSLDRKSQTSGRSV